MDFLCKMSVSNIYFKLSFLVTKNKFSTTSSASLPLPKICRWRWHPKCPQIWLTASQPLFSPYIHTECPPAPLHGSHWLRAAGWWQWQEERLQQKASSRCTESFTVAPQRRRKTKVCSLTTECPWDYWGWRENQKGGGGDTEEEGGAVSPSSQVGLNLWLSHEGRGEKLSPQKNVWEKKIQVGGGGGMKGEGVEVGGWGVFTYYMCDITRSLPFSTKIQRTSAGQSPSPQNQEKKNSQMYFLLTQRL